MELNIIEYENSIAAKGSILPLEVCYINLFCCLLSKTLINFSCFLCAKIELMVLQGYM